MLALNFNLDFAPSVLWLDSLDGELESVYDSPAFSSLRSHGP
jgi:hypothetical protein